MSRMLRAGALAAEALALLVGIVLAAAGGALLYGATQRDAGGYVVTGYERVSSAGCAVVARGDLGVSPESRSVLSFLPARPTLVRVRPVGGDALVVATAPRAVVEAALSGYAYDELTSPVLGAFPPQYRAHVGARSPCPSPGPGWAVRAAGSATLTVRVPPEANLSLVVLRADGRPGVAAEVAAGIHGGWFLPLGVAFGVSGVAVVVAASLLLASTTRSSAGKRGPGAPAAPGPPVTATSR